MNKTDFLIVGAGIVGLALTRALRRRYPDAKILVLEKEAEVARHASGRNSGVVHSGIYYQQGSLKAQICAEGAQRLIEYCHEHALPIKHVGKVIIPVSEGDIPQFRVLQERASLNRSGFEIVDAAQLASLEPHAACPLGYALYNARVPVVDPRAVVTHLAATLRDAGVTVRLRCGLSAMDARARVVRAAHDHFSYGHLFNAAGLHADTIAKAFGAARKYRILPFRGAYYRLRPASDIVVNGLIYPVPDLRFPFLGVHATRTVEDAVYFGPTAAPAAGRENYSRFRGIQPLEVASILWTLAVHYARNEQGFRRHVHTEAARAWKPWFVRASRKLIPGLKASDLEASAKVGIRAQLVDMEKRMLVMDFLVEEGEHSTHVLNAVSPGFTCAFRFAEYVVETARIN